MSKDRKSKKKGLMRYVLCGWAGLVILAGVTVGVMVGASVMTPATAVTIHPGQTPAPGAGGDDLLDDILPTPPPTPTPAPTPAPTPPPSSDVYTPCGEVHDITLESPAQNGRQVTYYDIYGGSLENRADMSGDPVQFLLDAAANQDNMLHWANLAYNIFESDGRMYWDHAGNGWDRDFGGGHYMDLIRYFMEPSSKSDGSDKSSSSGISVATSLSDVQHRAGKMLADMIGRKVTANDFVSHHSLDAFSDGSSGQNVVYTIAANVDRYGSSPQYGYTALGICLYDFQVYVLDDGGELNTAIGSDTPKDAASKSPNVTYTSDGTDSVSVLSTTKNRDAQAHSTTLTLENSGTGSASSSTSTSRDFGMSQSIGMSSDVSVKVPAIAEAGLHLSTSVGFTESFGFTKEAEKARSVTTGTSVTNTIEVPPHTAAAIKESKNTTTVTTKYDCPVGITYKVAIFSMCGTVYDDNLLTQSWSTSGYDQRTFITIFGDSRGDANENLYQRVIVHGNDKTSVDQTLAVTQSRTRSTSNNWAESLNWKNILAQDVPTTKEGNPYASKLVSGSRMAENIVDRYPMSVSGATMECRESSYSTDVAPAVPLYPIATISMDTQRKRIFNLDVGDSLPIYSYKVIATDKDAVPYYGFVQTWGEWKVVGTDSKPCTSDVIEVTYDPVTKQQRVVAKAPGSAYVMYFINEDTYYTADGEVSKNEDISSAAYQIVVSSAPAKPFDGTIQLTGEVEAAVGEPVNLNSLDSVTCYVYDKTSKMVDKEVKWESQELSKYGIEVTEDGVLTCTKAGTFHVRAFIEDVYSDWIPVYAKEVMKGSEALILSKGTPRPIVPEVPDVVPENVMEFDPDTMVSRGEFIEMLHTICGHDGVGQSAGAGFSDVTADSPYNDCLNWAKANGFINGDGCGKFNPDSGITREQVATILYNIAKAKGLAGSMTKEEAAAALAGVKDSGEIHSWSREAVAYAVKNGMLKTDEDGRMNCGDYMDTYTAVDAIVDAASGADMIPEGSVDDTAGEP